MLKTTSYDGTTPPPQPLHRSYVVRAQKQWSGGTVCKGVRGTQRTCDPRSRRSVADDGRAFVACQPLAHRNQQLLVLSRAPSFLWRVLKAKMLSAACPLAMEAGRTRADRTGEGLGDVLQADGVIWGRACWIAARGHQASWRLTIVCRGHQRSSARI